MKTQCPFPMHGSLDSLEEPEALGSRGTGRETGGSRHLEGVIQCSPLVPGPGGLQGSSRLFCLLGPAPGDLSVVDESSLQALGPPPEIPASLSEPPETPVVEGRGSVQNKLPPPAPAEKSQVGGPCMAFQSGLQEGVGRGDSSRAIRNPQPHSFSIQGGP